jgi:Skp family chaperone for outer membrane proteins
MKRAFVIVLAVAFVTPGFVFLSAEKTRSQESGRSPTFGFMNVKKAIDGYQKTLQLEQEIDKERAERGSRIEAANKELKQMRARLGGMDSGSGEYADLFKKVQERSASVAKEEEDLKAYLKARLLTATKEVYEDIVKACETLRREKGLDLLMKIEDAGLDSESKSELILRINSRAVLSYAGELDFTDDLIAKLNK